MKFNLSFETLSLLMFLPFSLSAMQAQIEERAERSWKLRDMLHLGKLNDPARPWMPMAT